MKNDVFLLLMQNSKSYENFNGIDVWNATLLSKKPGRHTFKYAYLVHI